MSNHDGYTMTEVGEIPSTWSVCTLAEIGQSLIGLTYSPSDIVDFGGVIVLRSPNVKNGKIVMEDIVRVSKKIPQKLFTQLNDILICSRNGSKVLIGKNALIKECEVGLTFGAFMTIFRTNYSHWIYHIMQSNIFRKQINANADTTINQITSADLNGYSVPLPPLPEQQKIADILSTVGDHINETEVLLDKTQILKKGMIQRLLTKGIGHTEFKDTEIGRIPEEWTIKSLSEIADIKGGKRLPKGEQLTDEPTDHPYIRVTDMFMGGIDSSKIKYVPDHIWPFIKQYTISKDDLFISVAGTLGIVGEVQYYLDGANLTENADKICRITCSKKYLQYQLQSDLITSVISNASTVCAQPKLAIEQIKMFPIPILTISEQHQIASILTTIDDQIDVHQSKLTTLTKLKSALMQQLLTGKIRVMV